jgi:hypothetical protein
MELPVDDGLAKEVIGVAALGLQLACHLASGAIIVNNVDNLATI